MRVDYADEGQGRPVVLIHSSVSGNRQWRTLTEALRDRYRVLALNLYGYGETTPWPAIEPQSLAAQAQLVLAVCDEAAGPVDLVGHSFGGSVALKSALLLGDRVSSMVLLEPNPFHLLEQAGRSAAWLETEALRDDVTCRLAAGDRARAAERFADYWLGEGTWSAMPDSRRGAFAERLAQNPYEWQAVMNEETAVEGYAEVAARTLVVSVGHAPTDPRDRRDPRAGMPRLVVPLPARGRPHGSADAARAREPDRAGVPRRRLSVRSQSAVDRRRSASSGGSGRRARRPCTPPRASGS